MKRRAYRKRRIQDIEVEHVAALLHGPRVVFAVDVAKEDMVGILVGATPAEAVTIAWKNPADNELVARLLGALRERGLTVEVVMEASGTYGDVLRHRLGALDFPIYRVSGKRAHDMAEVHDGVPSLHDAKSAAIIAKLHLDGASSRWMERPKEERELRAALATMDLFQQHHLRLIHQLEALLARHWPEITALIELTAATLLALLGRIGGPREITRQEGEARKLLHGLSHGLMSAEKIDAVLASARATAGVPLEDGELEAVRILAGEAHRALKEFKSAKLRVEELSRDGPAKNLAPVTGKATAAVLIAYAGDPKAYSASRAYVKALGLNLKEKSSGKVSGPLSITKRGPSRARQWLWLAVLRWVQKDENAAAWYAKKVARDGGKRGKAIVALMRKLAKALYHVARGAPFDSQKLFTGAAAAGRASNLQPAERRP